MFKSVILSPSRKAFGYSNNYWQVIFKVNRTEGPRTSKMKGASLTNVTNLPPILTQFNSSLTLTIYSSVTLSLDVSCFGKKKKMN